MLGIYKIYSSFVSSGHENLRHGRLEYELQHTMNTINRELRRASTEVSYTDHTWDTNMDLLLTNEVGDTIIITPGDPASFPIVAEGDIGPILGAGPAFGDGRVQITSYDGIGASAQGLILTPFTNLPPNGKLLPGEWFVVEPGVKTIGNTNRVLSSGSCILFSYDKNKNAVIENDGSTNEQFGFRLTTENGVGVVQKRTGGTFTDCTTGTWADVTDPKVLNITGLDFTITSNDVLNANSDTISREQVDVSLTGELVEDPGLSKSLVAVVTVRNDQYQAS